MEDLHKISFTKPEDIIFLDIYSNEDVEIDLYINHFFFDKQYINVKKLTINRSNLTNLCSFPNLEELVCYECAYLNFDALPSTLKKLKCIKCYIKKLDNLPINLVELDCSHNLIENIDYLPPGLQRLRCVHNTIKSFDNLPPNLKSLTCYANYTYEISTLPLTLEKIWIDRYIDLNIDWNEHQKLDRLYFPLHNSPY